MNRKELRLEESPSTLGKTQIYEVTVSAAGKDIRRHIVCEMNTLRPDWRKYAGRFIGALNAKGESI